MKPTLYLETTIPSYLVARPSRDPLIRVDQERTRRWWREKREGFSLFISPIVWDEAAAGSADYARKRLALLADVPQLNTVPAVGELADELLTETALPAKAAADATHIAHAAVYRLDFLLTWNCRHLANPRLQRRIEAICARHGVTMPIICTPPDLLGEYTL